MAHPWHDIPLPDSGMETFPAVIEVPRGSKNKYELDKHSGLLMVDRVLYSSMHYPANYGFIPRTLAEDGDPLDVLVLGQEPVYPRTIVIARPIASFRMRDEKGLDDKVVCVHVHDPAFRAYTDLQQLPSHVVTEMMHFFDSYKQLEGKLAEVGRLQTREETLRTIVESVERYRQHFPEKATS